MRTAHGEEVERAVVGGPQREVAHRDRRHEPVVEALGQPELRVHRVPREPLDRTLVQRELARVVEPEHLDVVVVRLAQLAELGERVLLDVPGISRPLGALRLANL